MIKFSFLLSVTVGKSVIFFLRTNVTFIFFLDAKFNKLQISFEIDNFF